jgi:hypothetical protein
MESSDVVSMGVAGALAQQYATDQREFLPMLAHLLKDALQGEVQLIETGLFKKTIRGVVLTHGDSRLTLEDTGRGSPEASHTKVVRGIALKTDRLSIEEWLTMVAETLEESARSNAKARAAMAKTLGLV